MNTNQPKPAAHGPEEFNRRMAEAIKAIPVIEGLIKDPLKFNNWLLRALQHETMARLNVSFEIMEALHTKKVMDLDMVEISYAVNCIEGKTPAELEVSGPEYIEIMRELTNMAAQWNAVAIPVKERISQQMQKEVEMRLHPGGKQSIKESLRPKIIH